MQITLLSITAAIMLSVPSILATGRRSGRGYGRGYGGYSVPYAVPYAVPYSGGLGYGGALAYNGGGGYGPGYGGLGYGGGAYGPGYGGLGYGGGRYGRGRGGRFHRRQLAKEQGISDEDFEPVRESEFQGDFDSEAPPESTDRNFSEDPSSQQGFDVNDQPTQQESSQEQPSEAFNQADGSGFEQRR